MLVLNRRVTQTLLIGDPRSSEPPIEVQITEVNGANVRIGVIAPRSVEVHRKEIWEANQAEKGGKP